MKYVIIGGGAAGIKAAEQIRSLEKDSKITIIMEDMNIHSRCMLHKYLSGERNIEEMSFLPKEMEDELNIEFFRGYTISSVDTDRKLVKIFPLKDQANDAKAKESCTLTSATGPCPRRWGRTCTTTTSMWFISR